ncbi:MAG: response regulator [Pseudobutyrivibrio sp.]|nr:response regulator [Pseudobutyrivibrio sp.]
MYNVMLVDDEEEVRVAIEKKINWEEIGFKVVATAENGQDALERAIETQPDVVLTDINMPFVNGLEFSKQLKVELPATKIVFFSGYDEFEYAKEAIELSAEEYILKPIDADELYKVFNRIKNSLDDEFDQMRNVQTLEKYYQESFPFFREQFLIGLIEGHIESDRIDDIVSDYGEGIEGNFYAVGIIKLSFDNKKVNNIDRKLLSLSLNKLTKESLQAHSNFYCINYLGSVIVLGCFEESDEYSDFVAELDKICKLSARILDIPTTAGVGQVVTELTDLFSSFKSAREAVSYRILFDSNQAISINDVEPKDNSANLFETDNVNFVLKQIKIGSKEELTTAIHQFFESISSNGILLYQLKLSVLEAYFEVVKLAKSYNIKESELLGKGDIFDFIDNVESISELEDWFSNKCFTIRDEVKQTRNDNTSILIEKAKEYILEHYSDSDLSVDRVCSYLNVSPNYFSAIFKKNTGDSFVTYLTNTRLQKAVELLDTTDEKAYIIAGMVGYDEPNYFSYVFKKAYGISPSKYRQKREH